MAEYIEREALLNAFDIANPDVMADYGPDYGTAWGYSRDAAKNLVKLIHSADVAPVRHGRWIDNGIPGSMLSGCSVCGFTCGAFSFLYCPMCGSKMDEEATNGD